MIRAIVTDIEGTTSSIRFVHDVLFLRFGIVIELFELSFLIMDDHTDVLVFCNFPRVFQSFSFGIENIRLYQSSSQLYSPLPAFRDYMEIFFFYFHGIPLITPHRLRLHQGHVF